jgi:hypothetical protein
MSKILGKEALDNICGNCEEAIQCPCYASYWLCPKHLSAQAAMTEKNILNHILLTHPDYETLARLLYDSQARCRELGVGE